MSDDWLNVSLAEVERRGTLSLACQVIYQCKVMALLRENLDRAAELLTDPVLMAAEYEKRWPRPAYRYTEDPLEETSSAG